MGLRAGRPPCTPPPHPQGQSQNRAQKGRVTCPRMHSSVPVFSTRVGGIRPARSHPRGLLAMPADICGCRNWEGDMLLAPGLRPGILLAIQQHAGWPRDKETPALNADSVEGETLASVSRESSQACVCRNHETTTLREQESWGVAI